MMRKRIQETNHTKKENLHHYKNRRKKPWKQKQGDHPDTNDNKQKQKKEWPHQFASKPEKTKLPETAKQIQHKKAAQATQP